MAMRGPGQIAELCEIAPPEVGVITNVGPVHLELLGTVEAVAEAKAELIAALPPHGFCVVPAAAEAIRPHLRTEVRTLTFADWPHPTGEGALDDVDRVAGAAADIRVLSTERRRVADRDGLRVQIAFGAERLELDFNFTQQHNVVNALAAVGAAYALGVPLESLAEGARSVEMSELRGDEIELPGGAVLLIDCYNANPVSMRAALDHLAELAAHRQAKRRVAVIGDMAELGPGADRYHRRIGELAAARGVDVLVAVGPLAAGYVDGFGNARETHTAADAQQAAAIVPGLIEPGDVVLLKASRSVGLERVADAVGGRRR
jgi:UDP-N-acetylmuramoyl-tripeptide--D-alanyl-D-alanine ligase